MLAQINTFKAIENGIKVDLEMGLKSAQEKMEVKAEAIESSNPLEPIAQTGLDLVNGLIDDIIVSINKE